MKRLAIIGGIGIMTFAGYQYDLAQAKARF